MKIDKAKIVILAACITILISAYIVYAATNRVYHLGADTTDAQVTTYKDANCQFVLLNHALHDFDPVSNGTVVTLWANNTGNVPVTVIPSIDLLSGCSVTVDAQFYLAVGQVVQMNMTIDNIVSSHVSWDLQLSYWVI